MRMTRLSFFFTIECRIKLSEIGNAGEESHGGHEVAETHEALLGVHGVILFIILS